MLTGPPALPTVAGVGLSVTPHPDPCCSAISCPAIRMDALRSGPVLGEMVTATTPVPSPAPPVMATHAGAASVDQGQPAGAVTEISERPPAVPNCRDAGEMAYMHAAP